MMELEGRNIFRWAAIMLIASFLYTFLSISFYVAYATPAIYDVMLPVILEPYQDTGSLSELTEEERKEFEDSLWGTIEGATDARMEETDMRLWEPLSNTAAWAVTALFLGFMKMVRFNKLLVIITCLPNLAWGGAPDILVTISTILLGLAVMHYVSKWMHSKRTAA